MREIKIKQLTAYLRVKLLGLATPKDEQKIIDLSAEMTDAEVREANRRASEPISKSFWKRNNKN